MKYILYLVLIISLVACKNYFKETINRYTQNNISGYKWTGNLNGNTYQLEAFQDSIHFFSGYLIKNQKDSLMLTGYVKGNSYPTDYISNDSLVKGMFMMYFLNDTLKVTDYDEKMLFEKLILTKLKSN